MRFLQGIWRWLALVPLLALAACSGGSGNGDLREVKIVHDGAERSFVVHVPPGFDASRSWPAVLTFHGGLGTGARMAGAVGMTEAADREGFVAVFPDASASNWNDGRATTRTGVDDIGYVRAVVSYLAENYGVDRGRVFAAGVSNGGMFTQRLACDAPGLFAAHGVVVANMPRELVGGCSPRRRTPIVFFMGTEDPLMPFGGGEISSGRLAGAGGQVLSTRETLDFWARVNGCGGPSREPLADRVDDGTSVVRVRYPGCGGAVVLYEIQGGGHTWPGTGRGGGRLVGTSSREINGTALMVGFFAENGL